MKILIMTGGTGSIALQTGIYSMLERHPGLQVKVLTNAYDNGKSTGTVRKVLNGKILGPSDVRKNQTTRLKLENPESIWNKFLDIRFDKPANEVKEFCLGQLNEIANRIDRNSYQVISRAITTYFDQPLALKVDYTDFSLANIIYAGLAAANGNSLRQAASIMAGVLEIEDNVILNDDKSLFLGAISKNGHRLTDEGDIVEWGKMDDPLVDIFFYDADGNESAPRLNTEAINAIEEANLIILSSGTQWSSLIPTYASVGFREAIQRSKAKIIMVMNTVPDKDSPGQTAADIVTAIVPKYFPSNRIEVLCNLTGYEAMRGDDIIAKQANSWIAGIHSYDMSPGYAPKSSAYHKTHDSKKLALSVFKAYFGLTGTFDIIMSDYDDTLVARGNAYHGISKENLNLFNSLAKVKSKETFICTGNTIKVINTDLLEARFSPEIDITFSAYADGGINRYIFDNQDGKPYLKNCIAPEFLLSQQEQDTIMDALRNNRFPMSKVEVRGNVCVSIKPVDTEFRHALVNYLNSILPYKAAVSGRTTIDIMKAGVSKEAAIRNHTEDSQARVLYIGDEVYNGNDSVALTVAEERKNLTIVNVTSVVETNALLKVLLSN